MPRNQTLNYFSEKLRFFTVKLDIISMNPVDSHCHLHFEHFDDDRQKLIRGIEEDLEFAVLAGCSFEDNIDARDVAKTSESLKYCMGLHPLYQEGSKVEDIREQINMFSPSAVGEIGLDYNYITKESEREKTIELFKTMLEIAEEEGLNAVIHSRNAESKCFELVQSYDVEGFFHCFNGHPDLAQKISDSGHNIGVTTQVVDSKRVRNIVESIALESIMLETDSPYLGQEERNTPLNVHRVAEEISSIKSVDIEQVKNTSTKVTREFFV